LFGRKRVALFKGAEDLCDLLRGRGGLPVLIRLTNSCPLCETRFSVGAGAVALITSCVDGHREILTWIDGQLPVMRERVVRWCGINSGTGNLAGLQRMTGELAHDFAVLGADVREESLAPAVSIDARGREQHVPLGKALRIVKRPAAPLRVLACIHMDTVYPADHPFQAVTEVDANTLRGPGVADAKGGLAIMLTALQALERSTHAGRIGWEVLINPDEEIGSPGSAPLLERAARDNHVGLVFEPTLPGGAMADRRRGVGNFTFVVRGRAAHAGRDFASGRNAVVAAAELVTRLHALNGDALNGDALPGVTVNVGRLEGGSAPNVVPDLAICRVNVRTTRPTDEPLIRAKLEELVTMISSRDGISVELHGGFTAPPKIPDPRTEALMRYVDDCGRELGLSLEWKPSGGACDGNRLAAAGLPTIDTLGPRGGDIHSPSEFLHVDSLAERAKLTALLLLKLASGQISL
jgi:glutamate carboxypeptidase